jgi:hypothetical protein
MCARCRSIPQGAPRSDARTGTGDIGLRWVAVHLYCSPVTKAGSCTPGREGAELGWVVFANCHTVVS